MRKIGILILLQMFYQNIYAQINLVPNFSFEQHDSCPDAPDQIERCIGWHKFSISVSTPDYYNSCAPIGYFNVPNSFNGYQQDHRNCNAFTGLVTFGVLSNDREYVGIELSQPLIVGQKYFLSFYVVMAELIYSNNYHFGMPTSNIGLRLSTVAYNSISPCPINNFAHLYSTAVINDSINWNRIAGSIVADSAYNYLIVGNFFDDLNTDTLHYTCDSCLNYYGYYYIDDLCLSTDSLLCNGGIDNIPCNAGITIAGDDKINIYPNPTMNLILIGFSEKLDVEFILFDLLGNIILINSIIDKNDYTMSLSSVLPGCYLLQINNKRNGKSIIKKIIKI